MDESILEILIQRARREPKALEVFYWALMRQELWVLGRVAEAGPPVQGARQRVLGQGQEIDLFFLETLARRRMLPAFTSEALMRRGLGGEPECLRLPARPLLGMLAPGDFLSLNPGTDRALELGTREIQGLLKGVLGRLRKSTRILLGPPRAVPWLVVRGLKAYFRACPLVKAAYLGERLENQPPGLAKVLEVGVVMEKGQEEEFVSQVAPELAVLATRFKGALLRFCLLAGKTHAEYRALKAGPFYQKGLVRKARRIRMYVPEKFEAKT
jgi:hypothetical protein